MTLNRFVGMHRKIIRQPHFTPEEVGPKTTFQNLARAVSDLAAEAAKIGVSADQLAEATSRFGQAAREGKEEGRKRRGYADE